MWPRPDPCVVFAATPTPHAHITLTGKEKALLLRREALTLALTLTLTLTLVRQGEGAARAAGRRAPAVRAAARLREWPPYGGLARPHVSLAVHYRGVSIAHWAAVLLCSGGTSPYGAPACTEWSHPPSV